MHLLPSPTELLTNRSKSPVYTLLETPQSPDLQSKLYLTDDPALVILYSQLRQKTLQTLRGASKVTPKVEWAFVLHSARLYDRMGCDLLALDLGKKAPFLALSGVLLVDEILCYSAKLGVLVKRPYVWGLGRRGGSAKNASTKKLACGSRSTCAYPSDRSP